MLSPHIQIQFDTVIWKIQIDETTDTICLEMRSAENKSVSFSSINIQTGQQYFRGLEISQRWLCGLAAAGNGVMLIHGYQSTILPLPKGLIAADEITGEILWEDHNINLEKLHPSGMEIYDQRLQPKKIVLADTRTKEVLIPGMKNQRMENNNFKYPGILNSDEKTVFILPTGDHAGNTHFLEHNGLRILSLHALKNGAISQYLQIYNEAGELEYEDIIDRDIQKLQPEAFIVYKNELVWIQDRTVLKVLHL